MSVCAHPADTSLAEQQTASIITREQLQASWPSCSQPPNLPEYGMVGEFSSSHALLHAAEEACDSLKIGVSSDLLLHCL